jgi:uncharacterized membrane protein
MTLTNLPSIIGAVLIVAGLLMIAYQMARTKGWDDEPSRSGSFSPTEIKISTTYPGLIVVALGVFMLTVGAITGR